MAMPTTQPPKHFFILQQRDGTTVVVVTSLHLSVQTVYRQHRHDALGTFRIGRGKLSSKF